LPRTSTPTPAADLIAPLRAELARRIARFLGTVEKCETEVPGLVVVRRTQPVGALCATYSPSLAYLAQGRKQVELGANTFVYGESKFLLTSLDLPIVSRILEASEAKPYLALMLEFDMTIVREFLSREDFASAPLPYYPDHPAMALGDVTPELLDALCRLIGLLDTPKDIPVLSGLIHREIVYRILQSPAGARLRAVATLGDQSQRTAKAIAYLKDNYAKPLRVEELAQIAGMAVSTLHHHFRALTAMSPLQYQKQLRLRAARNHMLTGGHDAASAAFAVGYESPSQFNREYRRLFGQPPSRDIRGLRSSGPASSPQSATAPLNI
jgi:AraC-like DNA-binding protein